MAFFHPADVIVQRMTLCLVAGMRRGKAEQTGDFFAVVEIFRRPFFQYLAKLVPEFLIVFRLFLSHLGQHIQHPFGEGAAHRVHRWILLQNFPGDVQ